VASVMGVFLQPATEDKVAHLQEILSGEAETEYLRAYNPDAFDGAGWFLTTRLIDQARRFDTLSELTECWRAQSRVRPLREDGQPNRPLTAHSISPLKV
jgi:hypothetical protein